jgi:hypothetical protein
VVNAAFPLQSRGLAGALATSGASPTASSQSSSDPKANFAAGLSALISQVSNNQAPAGLQSAFFQVVTDLQRTNGTAGTSSGATTSSNPQATLQALLTQMQQNLGYGATSSSSALGNILTAQA